MKSVINYILLPIVFILCFFIAGSSVFAFQDKDTIDQDSLTFSVDGGNIYFYDSNTKTVYVYSVRGDFRKAFSVNSMGENLKQLSLTDIRLINDKQR